MPFASQTSTDDHAFQQAFDEGVLAKLEQITLSCERYRFHTLRVSVSLANLEAPGRTYPKVADNGNLLLWDVGEGHWLDPYVSTYNRESDLIRLLKVCDSAQCHPPPNVSLLNTLIDVRSVTPLVCS